MARTKLPDAPIPSIEQDDMVLDDTSVPEWIPKHEALEDGVTKLQKLFGMVRLTYELLEKYILNAETVKRLRKSSMSSAYTLLIPPVATIPSSLPPMVTTFSVLYVQHLLYICRTHAHTNSSSIFHPLEQWQEEGL
jgi:hypothetical protein